MRKTIYVGFDDTLVDSTRLILDIYNERYQDDVGEDDVKAFELIQRCTRLGEQFGGDHNKEIEEYYASDYFWNNIKPKKDVIDSLNSLKEIGFEIVMISNGGTKNIEKKLAYVQREFPMLSRCILLYQSSQPFTKKDIDMRDAFFVDDNVSYLVESNASVKIMFGKPTRGNRNPGFFSSSSWTDITRYIARIEKAHSLIENS